MELLSIKFQDKVLAKRLIATGDAVIIEAIAGTTTTGVREPARVRIGW